MTKELNEALKRLEEISPELNAATDKASEIVRLVEQFLNERCSIGIRNWVRVASQMSVEEDPEGDGDEKITVERGRVLSYDRVPGGSFRICIQEVQYKPDVTSYGRYDTIFDGDPVPWSQAKRDEKLESFAELPALLQAIAEQAKARLVGAGKAVAAAKQITDAMVKPKNQ